MFQDSSYHRGLLSPLRAKTPEEEALFEDFKNVLQSIQNEFSQLGAARFFQKYASFCPTQKQEFILRTTAFKNKLRTLNSSESFFEYLIQFLFLGHLTKTKVEMCLAQKTFPDFLLIDTPELSEEDLKKKYAWISDPWFLENAWKNYFRLMELEPPVSYNEVFQNAGYNITENLQPSQFAHSVARYGRGLGKIGRLLEGTLLTIGSGPNIRDEKFFVGAAALSSNKLDKILINDTSGYVIQKVQNILQPENASQPFNPYANKIHIEGEPMDTFQKLEKLIDEKTFVDTIYSLSVFHYFDNVQLKALFEKFFEVLQPGGHLAFSVKVPKTTFDGVGIPLSDKSLQFDAPQEMNESPTERIWTKTWMGLDGQIRTFRDYKTFEDILEKCGFEIVISTRVGIEENYEFDSQGSDTKFYQFIVHKPIPA